uniref:ZAD domain-containing protein n=1 Tax=Anopheles atroparvus TaxID=41427 RepID=A0AAG5DIT3_ANOAO
MSSASSSTTAGSNAAAANQSAQQAGAAGGSASGPEGSAGDNHGAEGNVVQPQQAAAGAGTTEPPTSSSSASTTSHHRGGSAASGTTGSMGTVLRRKTNVCLICGIYTNLSLNIFEPRNGPNIVDVIYEKYKFRAERGDNADKHICFSCNNWLINWYSLQNTSSGSSNRTYEPAPSTSRSSSSAAPDSSNNRHRGRHHHQGHKSRTKRTMAARPDSYPPNDKENCPTKPNGDRAEQYDQVSSTTPPFPAGEEEVFRASAGLAQNRLTDPYAKRTKRRASPIAFRRAALRESNSNLLLQQRLHGANKLRMVQENSVAVVSSSSSAQQRYDAHEMHEPFESLLIRMLEGQGTSVTKECVRDGEEAEDENGGPRAVARWNPEPSNGARGYRNLSVMRKRLEANRNGSTRGLPNSGPFLVDDDDEDTGNEIVLSFDSALSELIDVVPSLKEMTPDTGNDDAHGHLQSDPVGPLRQRLSSGVLSMSIIPVRPDRPKSINW